jgi:hypothetical protein
MTESSKGISRSLKSVPEAFASEKTSSRVSPLAKPSLTRISAPASDEVPVYWNGRETPSTASASGAAGSTPARRRWIYCGDQPVKSGLERFMVMLFMY